LNEEYKDFNKGQKLCSASSVIQALKEEGTIEKRHPKNQTDDNKDKVALGDQIIVEEPESGSLQIGRTEPVNGPLTEDNVLLGVPANHTSPDGNEHRARSLRSDADSTASTRATTRANFGSKPSKQPWTVPTMKPKVELQDFEDPISDAFWKNIWVASAVHNTEIYRKVFHAVPDDLVTTWKQYREFVAYHERLKKPTRDSTSVDPIFGMPSESSHEGATHESHLADPHDMHSELSKGDRENGLESPLPDSSSATAQNEEAHSRRRSKGSQPFEKWEREEMEKLLLQLNGQLVIYPHRFLEGEDFANNFLFNADRFLPLPIYN